jgi:hypothetical protein
MSGNFTVMTPEQEQRLRKLEVFHSTIRELALTTNLYKTIPIYEALSAVDEKWRLASMGNLEERN